MQKYFEHFSKALCGLICALALVAALVVIIPCWPSARSAVCLHDVSTLWLFQILANIAPLQSYRWIFLTAIDVVTELLIIGLPLFTLRNIQFREAAQKWKLMLVITVGRCRLVFETEDTKRSC